jgi:hypothetical protein
MEYKPKVVKNGLEYYVCEMVFRDLQRKGSFSDYQVTRKDTKLPLFIPKSKGLDYCNNNLCKEFDTCRAYDTMLEDKIVEMKLMLGVRNETRTTKG